MQICSIGMLLALAAVALASTAAAVPVEKTKYGESALRIECRPDPLWSSKDFTLEQMENALADAGVQARWTSVVSPLGSPVYASKFIPTDIGELDKREAALKDWVATIHKRGMAAISWYPLILSKSGLAGRPEWGQVAIVPNPPGVHRECNCCFNTGYGQALIDFCNEAIDLFGLDGFWFDGSAWTQIWDRPIGLTCACDDCKRLFKQQTGLELPTKLDWNDAVFRKWVAWRYDTFGAYIGKLAAGIRSKHPNAVVVVNHYHRISIPWQSAIPLNPYPADIITGSEASGEEGADLTVRLCRAYGLRQSEVWMPFQCGDDPDTSPKTDKLVHHALTCVTAGGMPSYGMDVSLKPAARTAKYVSGVLDKIRPYVCPDSLRHAAIHVSQQSETFYFSRAPKGVGWEMEPYWKSIQAWTQGLMQAHVPPDYVYDKSLTAAGLKGYKLLVMPLSLALSDEQCRTILDFAKRGGTVILGPCAGSLDEWGEKRSASPLQTALGITCDGIPSPAASETRFIKLRRVSGKDADSVNALFSRMKLRGDWRTLYETDLSAEALPVIAAREVGRGKVIAMAIETGPASVGWGNPVTGGDTTIAVTDETAASGKHSLKFVDGPNAPEVFYPDMEINFSPIGPPEAAEATFACSLRVEKGADVLIELRNILPKIGPSLRIGREGKLWAGGKPLCDIPLGKWFRVGLVARLSGDNRTCDLTVTLPGAQPSVYKNLPYQDQDFGTCNWMVIAGIGNQPAAFYVDDIVLNASTGGPEPAITTVFQDDFEAARVGEVFPRDQMRSLVEEIARMAPPPVAIDAPPHVRAGIYSRGASEIIVHLHNLHGSAIKPIEGDPVTIRCSFPIRSAKAAILGKLLEVVKTGGGCQVKVPEVALHEVVVLAR